MAKMFPGLVTYWQFGESNSNDMHSELAVTLLSALFSGTNGIHSFCHAMEQYSNANRHLERGFFFFLFFPIDQKTTHSVSGPFTAATEPRGNLVFQTFYI